MNRIKRASVEREKSVKEDCPTPRDHWPATDAIDASQQLLSARIRRLRRQVNESSYDCPLKLSIAMDRLIEKVVEVKK